MANYNIEFNVSIAPDVDPEILQFVLQLKLSDWIARGLPTDRLGGKSEHKVEVVGRVTVT